MTKISVRVFDRIDEVIPLVEAIWMMAADLDQEDQRMAFRRVCDVITGKLIEIREMHDTQ